MKDISIENVKYIFMAPLLLVVKRQPQKALIWIAVYGFLLHLENYLMAAERKLAYSIFGMAILPTSGIIFELITAVVFSFICAFSIRILVDLKVIQDSQEDFKLDLLGWFCMYGAAVAYPAVYLLLLVLFFGGSISALYGGVLFGVLGFLLFFSYKRYSYAGIGCVLVAYFTTHFLLKNAIHFISSVAHYIK